MNKNPHGIRGDFYFALLMKHLLFILNKSSLKIAFHSIAHSNFSVPIAELNSSSLQSIKSYLIREGLLLDNTYLSWIKELSLTPSINYLEKYDKFFQEFITLSLIRFSKENNTKLKFDSFEVFNQAETFKVLLVVNEPDLKLLQSYKAIFIKVVTELFQLEEIIEFEGFHCFESQYQQLIWTSAFLDNNLSLFHEGTLTGKDKATLLLENNNEFKQAIKLHSYSHPNYTYTDLIQYLDGAISNQLSCVLVDFREEFYGDKEISAFNQLSESYNIPIYFLNTLEKFNQLRIVTLEKGLLHHDFSLALVREGVKGEFQLDYNLFTNKWESYLYKDEELMQVIQFIFQSKINNEKKSIVFVPIAHQKDLNRIQFKLPITFVYYKHLNKSIQSSASEAQKIITQWIQNNFVVSLENEDSSETVCITFNESEVNLIGKDQFEELCLQILQTYRSFNLTKEEIKLISLPGDIYQNTSKLGIPIRIPYLII